MYFWVVFVPTILCFSFFPTCQVRVSRLYPGPSCFLLLLFLLLLLLALLLLLRQPRVSTASSGCQWALPDLDRECQISRTSTAGTRFQWALPGLNREPQFSVGTAGIKRELQCQGGGCSKKVIHFRSVHCLQHMFSKCGAYIPLLQSHGSTFCKKNEWFGHKQVLQLAKAVNVLGWGFANM